MSLSQRRKGDRFYNPEYTKPKSVNPIIKKFVCEEEQTLFASVYGPHTNI